MKVTRTLVAAIAAGVVCLVAGCRTTSPQVTADAGIVNANCPYSQRPVNPSVSPATFQGKQVGFCCNRCAGTWASATDAEKHDLLKKSHASN